MPRTSRHPDGSTIISQRINQLDLTIVAYVHTSTQYATVYGIKGEAPMGNYAVVAGWLDANIEAAQPVATLSRRMVLDRTGPAWRCHTTDGIEVPHTKVNADWVSVAHLMLRLALAMVDKAKAEADKAFSIPEIAVMMDEREYIRAVDLIGDAAALVGDGQGNELGGNPEYERGMAELITRAMGWPADTTVEVLGAIHATAKDNANR